MQGPTPHASPIKNWKQLVVVIVLAFVVPIAVIVLLSQYVTDVSVPAGEDVLSRIKPVGEVVVEGGGGSAPAGAAAGSSTSAPVGAAASATAAAPTPPATAAAPKPPAPSTTVAAVATSAAPAAAKADGKKVYDTACMACHAPGVAGAPKFGDKAQWAPRLKQGIDTLYTNALKGKGAMPSKGGNASLSDADVKAAVDYMVAAVK